MDLISSEAVDSQDDLDEVMTSMGCKCFMFLSGSFSSGLALACGFDPSSGFR